MQKIPRIGARQLVAHYGSQRLAAEALGVTQQAVSLWCAKGRIPREWQAVAAFVMGRTMPPDDRDESMEAEWRRMPGLGDRR